MDLWKDRVEDNVSNDYGSRGNKEKKFGWGKVGKIEEGNSYVPAGLTAAQYNKIRSDQKVSTSFSCESANAGFFPKAC